VIPNCNVECNVNLDCDLDYTLVGLINGINNTYTTTFNINPDKLHVFVNGIKQKIVDDYTIPHIRTINFNVSPEIGDKLEIYY
jgi:hypothetical protein